MRPARAQSRWIHRLLEWITSDCLGQGFVPGSGRFPARDGRLLSQRPNAWSSVAGRPQPKAILGVRQRHMREAHRRPRLGKRARRGRQGELYSALSHQRCEAEEAPVPPPTRAATWRQPGRARCVGTARCPVAPQSPLIAPQSTTWSIGHRAGSAPCPRGRRLEGTSPVPPRPTPAASSRRGVDSCRCDRPSDCRPELLAHEGRALATRRLASRKARANALERTLRHRHHQEGQVGDGASPCNGSSGAPTAPRRPVRRRGAVDDGA